jgi:hypothetical protein
MDGARPAQPRAGRIRGVLNPAHWTLWQQRGSLIFYCFLVEPVALAATVWAAVAVPARGWDLAVFGVLTCLGVLQAELGRKIERVRRLVSDTPHINLTSVWTFAGVLLLPPALVTALIAVLYLHLATRSLARIKRVPPFRTTLNAALRTCTAR